MKHDRGIVFSADGLVDVIFGGEDFPREGFERLGRLLADGMEGLEIRINFFHMQASDEGQQVEPVRTNIAHSPKRATKPGLQPPVPVGREEQPILQIRTLHDE